MDPGFFYETVAPLLIVGNTSLIAISTLLTEINFYSRLLRMRDKITNLPLFSVLSVTLACAKCREEGKAGDCPHMLHLVPRWQSGDRHMKLKTIMQDRPDLIESELSGLAFDSLQQVFRSVDMEVMFTQKPPSWVTNDMIHLFIDPAAGGPGSDYALVSVARQKGLITVSPPSVAALEAFRGGHGAVHVSEKEGFSVVAWHDPRLQVQGLYELSQTPLLPAERYGFCYAREHLRPVWENNLYTWSGNKVGVLELLHKVQ